MIVQPTEHPHDEHGPPLEKDTTVYGGRLPDAFLDYFDVEDHEALPEAIFMTTATGA